eukprot:6177588-Pleurochrysis_carterae.AAC.1
MQHALANSHVRRAHRARHLHLCLEPQLLALALQLSWLAVAMPSSLFAEHLDWQPDQWPLSSQRGQKPLGHPASARAFAERDKSLTVPLLLLAAPPLPLRAAIQLVLDGRKVFALLFSCDV